MAGIGGLGNSDSALRYTATTQGDNGNSASGRNSNVTEAGGITFGTNSNTHLGGLDLSRVHLAGTSNLNVNLGTSDDTLLALSGSYLDSIKQLNDQNAANITGLTSANSAQQKTLAQSISETVAAALANIQSLAENKQTDGISGLSKTFLWLALGSLALIAFVWTRKKS